MLNFILLQLAIGGTNYSNLIMYGMVAVIVFFFFIRPHHRKQKNQKAFSEGIQKGEIVITIGGIHGKVLAVEDTTITLEIDKGAKIKLEKSSVSMEATKKLTD